MNLDDFEKFSSLDSEGMLSTIVDLPEQLRFAWQQGFHQPLQAIHPVERVVFAGAGGSAIAAELIAGILSDIITVPILCHHDYDLPAWAFGKETLVVVYSQSGNTEETLSAFEQAIQNKCQVIAFCGGGELETLAENFGITVWQFDHHGQPGSALGYAFGYLLALFVRIGLVGDLSTEIDLTISSMQKAIEKVGADVPVNRNPAKRLAGQMVGRQITIYAGGTMAGVARRWKNQLNEIAKTIASVEILPEADHNALAGIYFPTPALEKAMMLFLQSSFEHRRNQIRINETRQIMMLEGINTDLVDLQGSSKLEQLWNGILFGDYVAYYLAMLNDVDPTPIPSITALKEAMAD